MTADERFDGVQRTAVVIAVVALVASAAGGFVAPAAALSSWLLAFMLWLGLSLGCLALLMLHLLTGGRWGLAIRRELEAAARVIPLLALAFLPVAFGVSVLYAWAAPDAQLDAAVLHKRPWLNVPFFLLRAAVYFAVWSALTWQLTRWSRAQDEGHDAGRAQRMRRLAAGGLVAYAISVTLAGTDWVMSLDPHWYSTILGVLLMGGQGLSALAFAILISGWLRREPPLAEVLTPDRFHDLGKLLLAFVILWAYFAFSQFLITWSENLPEEIRWYVQRSTVAWQLVALALVVFHFAVPFALLLSRRVKRAVRPLLWVAAGIAAMRVVDLVWLIVPSVPAAGPNVIWLAVAAPAGLGGLWFTAFLWQLRARPLLPLHDPGIAALRAPGGV